MSRAAEPLAFSLLAKPTSDRCGLACTYCTYKGSRWHDAAPRMTVPEAQALMAAYGRASAAQHVTWQGGEPTDCGAEFFSAAVEAQTEHCANSMQTNGMLFAGQISEQWERLLVGKGHWIVGLSHDGPTNVSRGISQSFLDSAAQNLLGLGVPFSLMCVVSEENVNDASDVIEHFYHQRFGDAPIQFIPAKGSTVTGLQFGEFLGAALARTPDRGARILNYRAFDAAWHEQPINCENLEECGTYMMIDSGRIYPCDHYGTEEWVLGELKQEEQGSATSWEFWLREAFTGGRMAQFRKIKPTPHKQCDPCPVRAACNRGCPADRPSPGELTKLCAAHAMVAHITHPARAGKEK